MRDARLAELEFLVELEKNGGFAATRFGVGSDQNKFALSEDQFREMVLHLLIEDLINGPSQMDHVPHARSAQNQLAFLKNDELDRFLSNGSLGLKINHKGRLRLWALRDELLSIEAFESFGILLDKRHFLRDLEIEMLFAEPSVTISVFSCDLDKFKAVNDKHGHSFGDDVLQWCFQEIKRTIEKLGKAYRVGGEEITVVLPNCDQENAKKLAEELRHNIYEKSKNEEFLQRKEVELSISIGGVTISEKSKPEVVNKKADDCLYRAKSQGRNRVVWEFHKVLS